MTDTPDTTLYMWNRSLMIWDTEVEAAIEDDVLVPVEEVERFVVDEFHVHIETPIRDLPAGTYAIVRLSDE